MDTRSVDSGTARLSHRELEVARLVAEGLTNREISRRLFISERTVDGHLEHVREKLAVNNRAQVAAWIVTHEVPATRGPTQTNFPHYVTSFVGRQVELAALKSFLAGSRMVTIVGPGGVGKSRLAAALGAANPEMWPDGQWWVDLAPVNDSSQVAGAVVAALALPGRGPAQEVAIAWLRSKRGLLVLDNCERLVKPCAEFCQAALESCPQLTIIATSQEALGLRGEAHWPVSPLPLNEAVDLFEARAGLVRPTYKVVTANLELATEICERVDGLPLAIELAAARIGMMTEGDILTQLSDRFRLLTGGNRTAPQRQQTLLSTLDWSYGLLTREEAMLFRRLSVFRGGFTFESAKAVCADGMATPILDALSGLVEKSMVVAEPVMGAVARYQLLESQLAYAESRLGETADLDLLYRRHFEHFRDSLDIKLGPIGLPLRAPDVAAATWIDGERGNLWAAVVWARNHVGDLGMTLAVRLAQAGFADINAMRRLLEDMLDRPGETGLIRSIAQILVATFANRQGDYDSALRMAEAAAVLARERGDVEALAFALLRAGNVHHLGGDLVRAGMIYDDAIAGLSRSSNRRLITLIRNNVALLAAENGRYAAAREILIECVATARAEGEVERVANYLDSLAWTQLGLDDHNAAEVSWKESLSAYSSIRSRFGTIACLEGLSCAASASGDDKRALRLAAVAERLADEWSYSPLPWMHGQAQEFQRRSLSRIGKRKGQEAQKEGLAMNVASALVYALGGREDHVALDTGPDS